VYETASFVSGLKVKPHKQNTFIERDSYKKLIS
jgi:hypothetical protein